MLSRTISQITSLVSCPTLQTLIIKLISYLTLIITLISTIRLPISLEGLKIHRIFYHEIKRIITPQITVSYLITYKFNRQFNNLRSLLCQIKHNLQLFLLLKNKKITYSNIINHNRINCYSSNNNNNNNNTSSNCNSSNRYYSSKHCNRFNSKQHQLQIKFNSNNNSIGFLLEIKTDTQITQDEF